MVYLLENYLYCLMKFKNIFIWRFVSGIVIDYGYKSREFYLFYVEKGVV